LPCSFAVPFPVPEHRLSSMLQKLLCCVWFCRFHRSAYLSKKPGIDALDIFSNASTTITAIDHGILILIKNAPVRPLILVLFMVHLNFINNHIFSKVVLPKVPLQVLVITSFPLLNNQDGHIFFSKVRRYLLSIFFDIGLHNACTGEKV